MNYTTYWSVLDSPSHTIKPNFICLIVAISFGLLWLLIKKFMKDNGDGEKLILLWCTGVFAVFGLLGYFVMTFVYKDNSDQYAVKMLNSPTTPKIEGVITNFQRKHRNAKYGGQTIESFMVDTVKFAYGDAALGKFNSFSKTYNNVIFDGQKVRITYGRGSPYGDNFNSILRLEIVK